MARDARVVAWFLGLEQPVTTRQVASRWDMHPRAGARIVRALRDAELAVPAGFEGKRFLWRPRAR